MHRLLKFVECFLCGGSVLICIVIALAVMVGRNSGGGPPGGDDGLGD
jgi:hypothetical protein